MKIDLNVSTEYNTKYIDTFIICYTSHTRARAHARTHTRTRTHIYFFIFTYRAIYTTNFDSNILYI